MAIETYYEDDDIISRSGSIHGETFSSRRSRRAGGCSLRSHSIDIVAKRLREQAAAEYEQAKDAASAPTVAYGHCAKALHSLEAKPRFNSVFHNYRFLVAMLGGFSVGLMMLLRYNITISILKMVNQTHLYLEEHPGATVDDMIAAGHHPGGEFNWNNEIQHMIMSWYMVAYTLPQVPATKIGSLIGSRLMVPMSLSLCAISTLLIPRCAYFGFEYVIVLRLFNGLGAASVFPMMISLVENWVRSDEISLGLSVAQGLVTILAAANPLVAGYLSSIHWSYSFYVPGLATLVFCVMWLILITDDPSENYFVSQTELDRICECDLSVQNRIKPGGKKSLENSKPNSNNKPKEQKSPDQEQDDGLEFKPDSWLQVFKVPSFYIYLIVWCGYCSSYSGFNFVLPTYLRQFLKISISQNGLYCFIVQSGAILAVVWPYPLLNFLENRLNFSTANSRKAGYFLACLVVSFTWFYVGCFHQLQLLMLFAGRCFHNGTDILVTGNLMSNYSKAGLSSLVFSMVNTFGNLSVVFTSTFMGWLLDYTAQSRQGWQMIYYGLAASQAIIWLLYATLVPTGPIKFKNKSSKRKSTDCEQANNKGQLQQVAPNSQAQLESGKHNDSSAILNNFDKLRINQANSEQTETSNEKESGES